MTAYCGSGPCGRRSGPSPSASPPIEAVARAIAIIGAIHRGAEEFRRRCIAGNLFFSGPRGRRALTGDRRHGHAGRGTAPAGSRPAGWITVSGGEVRRDPVENEWPTGRGRADGDEPGSRPIGRGGRPCAGIESATTHVGGAESSRGGIAAPGRSALPPGNVEAILEDCKTMFAQSPSRRRMDSVCEAGTHSSSTTAFLRDLRWPPPARRPVRRLFAVRRRRSPRPHRRRSPRPRRRSRPAPLPRAPPREGGGAWRGRPWATDGHSKPASARGRVWEPGGSRTISSPSLRPSVISTRSVVSVPICTSRRLEVLAHGDEAYLFIHVGRDGRGEARRSRLDDAAGRRSPRRSCRA